MNSIANVFKVSFILLVLMCGIMTGQVVEKKDERINKATVDMTEIQNKEILIYEIAGIEVYFDYIENGTVNLIVSNQGENKLQEMSIVNMEVDGVKVDSYSYLDGIKSKEIKRCSINYDTGNLSNPDITPSRVTGGLYVRGSNDYIYQKIHIDSGIR